MDLFDPNKTLTDFRREFATDEFMMADNWEATPEGRALFLPVPTRFDGGGRFRPCGCVVTVQARSSAGHRRRSCRSELDYRAP